MKPLFSQISKSLLLGSIVVASTAMLYPFDTQKDSVVRFDSCSNVNFDASIDQDRTQPKPKPTASTKKKLTIMIYMAADNNLKYYVDTNRRWIEREGVDPDLNMLLFICTHREGGPKLTTKEIIIDHKVQVVEKIKGLDSGNKDTLIKACEWATQYPSDEYAVILWDHGSGPLNKDERGRGVCYDNTTGHFLADYDLYDAFTTVSEKYMHGKKFAFIGFDACLMGAIEIASVLKPFTNYMISSEHTISAVGWPYHFILKLFKEHKNNLTSFITNDIVNAYQNYYDRLSQDYTLSCVDVNKIDPLIENINDISQTLSELLHLQKNHSVSRALSDASAETTRFDEPTYADLCDWYNKIDSKLNRFVCIKKADTTRLVPRLRAAIMKGIMLIKQAVVAAVQGTYFSQSHGMLIYLPDHSIDKTYTTTRWYSQTQWARFLSDYLAQHKESLDL